MKKNEKKPTMPTPVRYPHAVPTFFLFWYRTETMDAGMPMPALVSSMSMRSYD
jgi:hypothetical protein